MLSKLAAFLPSLTIGTISVTEFLSRVRLAVSGHLQARVLARFAGELPARVSALVRADAHFSGSAVARIFHLAFMPAHAVLSLVTAMVHTSSVALLTVVHAAPLYLSQWL